MNAILTPDGRPLVLGICMCSMQCTNRWELRQYELATWCDCCCHAHRYARRRAAQRRRILGARFPDLVLVLALFAMLLGMLCSCADARAVHPPPPAPWEWPPLPQDIVNIARAQEFVVGGKLELYRVPLARTFILTYLRWEGSHPQPDIEEQRTDGTTLRWPSAMRINHEAPIRFEVVGLVFAPGSSVMARFESTPGNQRYVLVGYLR